MKKLTGIRAAILLLAFVFAAVFTGQAASDDAKALFDRYQAVYKNYREAVDSRADAQTIKDLAAELQDACQAYYNSIGMTASFKSDDSTDPVLDGSTRSKSETENSRGGVATPRKVKSAEQKKYDALILALSAADRSNRLDSLQKQLEAFIAGCRDENLLKEATFQLADLVLERTSSLTMAQDVLLKYAKNTRNAENRRQAMARIKMLHSKSIVAQKREVFRTIQQTTINKWGKYSSTSWLALPVKIFGLGSYAVSNVQRRFKARELDKALEDFDKSVLATYPAGSTDALTRSRLVPLNRVRLLANGRTSFHYRFEYARRAQSTLFVQTLLYQDDETGNQLTDIMIERAQAGVDVRLILDDFFSFGKKDGVIQRLRNGGVKVLINNPILKNLLKANFRSHQKLFIIDDTIAIVGGMNIGDEYAKGEIAEYGWRDTDVEVQGPVVRDILDLFERNWEDLTLSKSNETGALSKYKKAKSDVNAFKGLKTVDKLIRGPIPVYFAEPPIRDEVDARFVTTFPINEQDDNVLDLFEIYLNRARSEVVFESAYFIPTDRLVTAIEDAVQRGVEVKVITNSIESNNHPSGGWAGRESYEKVLRVGARIFEYQGAQTLHSKVSLFDNFAVTLGAYNVNSRSHSSDSEDVIAFEDYRVAAVFRRMLDKDFARCREITLEEAQAWDSDFMKKMRMEFFNLFKFLF
ncbi:MAG TPA: phosphatidylserine/phosphatidylglycerophosphate/cardiolipin synthase family protein [Candidatus Rifleibacterium sp.]|nr:phosphatidylserine/phosphatidylglycerophosphate/cardiolipin synthase family protein [Candidatus Rifleibacterium sp.]